MTKQDILQVLPKMSDVVQALYDGLSTLPETGRFKVIMSDFGTLKGGICYGCAATAVVVHKFGVENVLSLRGRYWDELHTLEDAIDAFRRGYPCGLVNYYNTQISPETRAACKTISMMTGNYKKELPTVLQVAQMLRDEGL